MKLVTYSRQGIPRLGAVVDEAIIDLAQVCGACQAGQDEQASLPAANFPADMSDFLEGGELFWKLARNALAWLHEHGASRRSEFVQPLTEIKLEPPVPRPSKIICVGLNYYDHAREQGAAIPERPLLFAKFPSSLIAPGESITWSPDATNQVDCEAELAVVIGRRARHVPAEEAADYVAGYTMMNDVSARDVQFSDKQWTRGKSFDTFGPCGPALISPDEIGDPGALTIQLRLNGELMQDSNTRELIFDVPQLIAFISRNATLLPGDIISTGTPGGVGVFRDPPVFLKPGDVVEVTIEGLGTLRNPVV